MKQYVVWKHRNGRTYRRRIRPGSGWTVPENCIDFVMVTEV